MSEKRKVMPDWAFWTWQIADLVTDLVQVVADWANEFSCEEDDNARSD